MNDFNQYIDADHASLPAGRTSHSGLGISSLIIACLGSVSMLTFIAVAGVMETQSPDGLDEESATTIILGLGMIGTVFVMLISAGLGIASLFQPTKKRLFGILGISISAGILALFMALMLIGLAMG